MQRRRLEVIMREGVPVIAAILVAFGLLSATTLPWWGVGLIALVVYGVFAWAIGESKEDSLKKDRLALSLDLIQEVEELAAGLQLLPLARETGEKVEEVAGLLSRICDGLRKEPSRFARQMYENLKYCASETVKVMEEYSRADGPVLVEFRSKVESEFLPRIEVSLRRLLDDLVRYRAIDAEASMEVLLDELRKDGGIRPQYRP